MRRRGGGTTAVAVADLVEESRRERADQSAAQIAHLSCEVSLNVLHEGVRNTALNLNKKPKTKYEYNKERVRDFRVNKAKTLEKPPLDLAIDELERKGKVSYRSLDTDPPRFYRDYKHTVFQSSLKRLHPSFQTFANVAHLDLSNQLLGDERVEQMCNAIIRSPVARINLSGNRVTDVGLSCLARTQRSLGQLVSLNLSWNDFSDKGIAYFLDEDHYSGTIEELNLSYNILGAAAAYHIGLMFQPNRSVRLSTLKLGGSVGRKCWGDAFLQVLVQGLMLGDMSKLSALHVPEFSVGADAMMGLVGLLCCDDIQLKTIDIAKNPMPQVWLRNAWLNALSLKQQPIWVQCADCCFEPREVQYLATLSNTLFMSDTPCERRWLGRDDVLRTCEVALRGFSACQLQFRETKQEVLNVWRLPMPQQWKTFVLPFPSDLRSNLESALGVLGMQVMFGSPVARAALSRLNDFFTEVYSLRDVYQSLQGSAVSGVEAGAQSVAVRGVLVEGRIDEVQRALRKLSAQHTVRGPLWLIAAETFVNFCCFLFKPFAEQLTKRRGRAPQLSSPDMESLLLHIEDMQSLAIEYASLLQMLIGRHCELRQVRRALSKTGQPVSETPQTCLEILHRTLPCCDTLGPLSFFAHHVYFAQHQVESKGV